MVQQWWFQHTLSQAGADAQAALDGFRAAINRQEVDWSAEQRSMDQPTDYPQLARQLEIQGEVVVRAHRDAQGRWLRAEVLSLQLRTPALGDERPLFIESLLDAPSLARAAQAGAAAGRPGGVTDFSLSWTLEDSGSKTP